jgi:hypothetical protein
MRRYESSDLPNGLEKTGLRQLDLPVEPLPSPHLRLERGRVRSRDLHRSTNVYLRNRMVSLILTGSLNEINLLKYHLLISDLLESESVFFCSFIIVH